MYSKNIMTRLFPALSEDANDPGVTDDAPDGGGDPKIDVQDLIPKLNAILGQTPTREEYKTQIVPPSDEVADSAAPNQDGPVADGGTAEQAVNPADVTGAADSTSSATDTDETAATAPPVVKLSPRQQTKQDLDALISQKVVDKNHGFFGHKGRLLEGLSNALAGMAMVYKMNPNASWEEELAGGGAGVGRGIADKTWNETRKHDADVARATGNYETAASADETESKLNDAETKRKTEVYNAMTNRQKVQYDMLDDERKQILAQVKDADEFDPNAKDANTQAIMKRVAALNAAGVPITILPHKKGDKFTFNVDQTTGTLLIGDTSTGAYHLGKSGPGRETPIAKDKISPTFLGIPADEDVKAKAKSTVHTGGYAERRVRPEVAQGLMAQTDDSGNHPYQNADGTLNETQAAADGYLTDTSYETKKGDTEAQEAAAYLRENGKYAEKRKLFDRFVSAVTTHKPTVDNPESVSLDDLQKVYKHIVDTKDPKKRKQDIERFFDTYLPSKQIR